MYTEIIESFRDESSTAILSDAMNQEFDGYYFQAVENGRGGYDLTVNRMTGNKITSENKVKHFRKIAWIIYRAFKTYKYVMEG